MDQIRKLIMRYHLDFPFGLHYCYIQTSIQTHYCIHHEETIGQQINGTRNHQYFDIFNVLTPETEVMEWYISYSQNTNRFTVHFKRKKRFNTLEYPLYSSSPLYLNPFRINPKWVEMRFQKIKLEILLTAKKWNEFFSHQPTFHDDNIRIQERQLELPSLIMIFNECYHFYVVPQNDGYSIIHRS